MTTAFFYQNPAILDREQHKHLQLAPVGNALFAAQSKAVPLLAAEFPDAAGEYPIVFVPTDNGHWLALALTGLADDENLFVDAAGRWNARYVPASVRRYPFILADGNPDQPDQLSVAIDLGCASVGESVPGGEALFDAAGEPGPLLKSALNLLSEFQGQVTATQAFIKRLADANLLVESNVEVKTNDHIARLTGAWIIDEARLRQLPDATAAAWFRSGELALVYAHMFSLRNLVPLLGKRKAAAAIPAATVEAGEAIH